MLELLTPEEQKEENFCLQRAEQRARGLVLTVARVGRQYLCTTTQGEWLVALAPLPGETIHTLKGRGVTCYKVEDQKENQCLRK